MERVARALVALLGLVLAACGPRGDGPRPAPGISVARALAAPAPEGFRRALAPREFVFPDDHGPHADFQSEWWYVTGHLTDTRGGAYGYQVTFFRRGLRPAAGGAQGSAWHSDALWMAHAALLEVGPQRFHAAERFEREALGLAGAGGVPLRVWVADWQFEGCGLDLFPLRLRAGDGDFALELEMEPEKPLALHGEAGLSRKSATPGHASYYYSATRLSTRGTLTVAGEARAVRGNSWLDREWSTSALAADQPGWDWFALQLDDGRELMVYSLRAADGASAPWSAGTLVARDGSTRALAAREFELGVREHWTSPASGVTYPSGWRLRLPGLGLELELEPLCPDAELNLTFRYWEGPVAVRGFDAAGALAGRGYAELVGYGDAPESGD